MENCCKACTNHLVWLPPKVCSRLSLHTEKLLLPVSFQQSFLPQPWRSLPCPWLIVFLVLAAGLQLWQMCYTRSCLLGLDPPDCLRVIWRMLYAGYKHFYLLEIFLLRIPPQFQAWVPELFCLSLLVDCPCLTLLFQFVLLCTASLPSFKLSAECYFAWHCCRPACCIYSFIYLF